MTDTVRTLTEIQALLADGQIPGSISPQDIRDMAVSLAPAYEFGATADGVTDDSTALLAQIATGKPLILDGRKTYLVSRPLVLSAGQQVFGNGGTLKRAGQVTTTTTTGITSGSTTSITVAAGTGPNFRVGQTIALFNGANYSVQNLAIQSIAGDVITVPTAWFLSAGSPWSGTTTVAVSFVTLTTATGCGVDGVIFDGNYTNWTKYHWELTNEIYQIGDNVTIKNCYLKNIPGEGIVEHGSANYQRTGCIYINNRIINANGNGIHLSASSGTRVEGNTITDCTLDAAVGHVGGCVTLSDGIEKLSIINNYFARSRCGVGEISTSDNRKILIKGNVFDAIALTANHSANGVTTSYAIEAVATTKDSALADIEIIGNAFHNSTGIFVGSTQTPTTAKTITGITKAANAVVSSTSHGFLPMAVVQFAGVVGMTEINGLYGTVLSVNTNDFTVDIASTNFTTYSSAGTATGTQPQRVQIVGNDFYNTKTPSGNAAVFLQKLSGFAVTGNVIHFLASDITDSGVKIAGSADGVVSGNQVKYGLAGVNMDTSANIAVTDNTFALQNTYGVYHGGGAGTANILVSSNVISNDSTANAGSYRGITMLGPTTVLGNSITLVTGYAGIRIDSGTASCVVQGNYVSSGSARSLAIESSATLFNVSGNVLSKAMTYNATAGAGNFGSATITAAATTVNVTHNAGYVPDVTDIQVTPTLLSSSAKWWISGITSTIFVINVDVVPGAGTATFAWKVG